MGSTMVKLGVLVHRFVAIKLPDLRRDPQSGDGWVRFVQTTGTGGPARAQAGAASAVCAMAGAAGMDHCRSPCMPMVGPSSR
jgi:hypothetical protein